MPVTARKFSDRVRRVLKGGFSQAGLPLDKLEIQPIRGTKMYRILITSPKFSLLRPSERQDIVWRMLKKELKQDEVLLISSVFTLTPEDIKDKD